MNQAYEKAKMAHLKTGGNFPFLSRSEEVNMHILVKRKNKIDSKYFFDARLHKVQPQIIEILLLTALLSFSSDSFKKLRELDYFIVKRKWNKNI